MICPKCEMEFHEKEARFCTECGTPLIKNRSIEDIEFNKNNKVLESQSKVDILIEQNSRIIELLEDLNKSN